MSPLIGQQKKNENDKCDKVRVTKQSPRRMPEALHNRKGIDGLVGIFQPAFILPKATVSGVREEGVQCDGRPERLAPVTGLWIQVLINLCDEVSGGVAR
jgi:hypothetical protein